MLQLDLHNSLIGCYDPDKLEFQSRVAVPPYLRKSCAFPMVYFGFSRLCRRSSISNKDGGIAAGHLDRLGGKVELFRK